MDVAGKYIHEYNIDLFIYSLFVRKNEIFSWPTRTLESFVCLLLIIFVGETQDETKRQLQH